MNDPNEVYVPEPTEEHVKKAMRELLSDSRVFALFFDDEQPSCNIPYYLFFRYEGMPLCNHTERDDDERDCWDGHLGGIVEQFKEWAIRTDRLQPIAHRLLDADIKAARDEAEECAADARRDAMEDL